MEGINSLNKSMDQSVAKRRALALQAEWETLKEQEHDVWPDIEATGRCAELSTGVIEVNASQMTVGEAIEMYRGDIRSRCEIGLVSHSYRNTTSYRLDWLYRAIPGRLLPSQVGPHEIKSRRRGFTPTR